ncbi:MAG: CBS and ACT domain-containing protein [Bacillota bacterium]|jgi:acetoin utilization protein AcuB
MFVRDIMTRNPVSIRPDASLAELLRVMADKTFEAIPVRDDGKVIGIVTDWDIVMNTPKVTGGDYLSKTKVRDIMTHNVVTVTGDEIVEMAAFHMYFHDMDALPVVDKNGELIAIVTQNDVFRTLVGLMGLRAQGTRVTVEGPDEAGMLAEVTGIVRDAGISIASLSTFTPPGSDTMTAILRLKTDDVRQLVESLSSRGFRVVHVSKAWQ